MICISQTDIVFFIYSSLSMSKATKEHPPARSSSFSQDSFIINAIDFQSSVMRVPKASFHNVLDIQSSEEHI